MEPKVGLVQETNYPWNGKVSITVNVDGAKEFGLGLRIPGWCRNARVAVNGEQVDLASVTVDGYAIIKRQWQDGDKVELDLPMEPVRVGSNPLVRADIGKVAIQNGPIVYCLEEVDNGPNLHAVTLPKDAELEVSFRGRFAGWSECDNRTGRKKAKEEPWGPELYKANACTEYEPVKLTFVPYYAWVNREPGEMTVWVREK